MKTKITCFALALVASVTAYAVEPPAYTITSYADVFPATESRLPSLTSVRKVEDTAVGSVSSASFATKIVFPDGVTSVTFSSASFDVESWVNGVYTIHTPTGVNMALSKFNPEGDVSTPSIFARDSEGDLIVPVNSPLVGTPIPNPKVVLITEQNASTLPHLVHTGDYWVLYRSLSGTYTLDGVVTPFSVDGQSAKVIVVNETDAPISTVTTDYPNNPKITSTTVSGGTVALTATGVTVGSYNQSWWMETSTDLVNWTIASNATVAPAVTISFPVISGEAKRFWRIKWLQP